MKKQTKKIINKKLPQRPTNEKETCISPLPNKQNMIYSRAKMAMKNVYHRYRHDPDIDIVLILARKGLRSNKNDAEALGKEGKNVTDIFEKVEATHARSKT